MLTSNTKSDFTQFVVESDLYLIGTVARPHGVRGGMSISFCLYPIPDLCQVVQVWLSPNPKPYHLQRLAGVGAQSHLFLASVIDRNQAEALRGCEMYVSRAALPKIRPNGKPFVQEMLGLAVWQQSDDGTPALLGTLQEVLITKAHWVYVVQTTTGELLLPDIPQVVQQLDLDKRVMYVQLLPGLVAPDN